MTWLVTGGAGYIGAHVVRALQDAVRTTGDERLRPVVVDDLSSGHAEFVPHDVPFVEASVVDTDAVRRALVDHGVTGVVHLAGYKYAGVSVQRPLHTYEQNVTGTAHLLQAMADTGVEKIVFSSSAAVYGTPDVDVVTEATATAPESPYGESKLVGEWLLRDQGVATGLRHTSLRYFNVVGSGSADLYDSSPHNLFPLVLDALSSGRTPRVNGTDYPTPDGTCVRDYVHVADLAVSHVAAARALADGAPLQPVYNLGSGDGLSVAQIMTTVAQVTGIDFTPEVGPRRPGDPARIVASGAAAARDLDWAMRHTAEQMVASAWAAHRRTTTP
ncbi:UDP-glucose 4-epimerase GalE [Cellulomonas sp. S1-8]|uniref:UDP-glucose 4-epimerase GalE n=1 Tax=Cellulomonas sp. S1-8 TaxID=2904790 RepID=UPI002242FCBD|nr:UDP-glucose 4-epimerase GalE [Cellulomonas sp. S1-8]UZN02578.1 UDP-glucose 4-epimerase GalE [Cellulomonas sp. S1-8]